MGRVRLSISKQINLLFILFGFLTFISCNQSKEVEVEQLRKSREVYLRENVKLEQESHYKFVNELLESKKSYFEDRVDKFIDDYDSFGTFNVIKRSWFRTDAVNKQEISQSLQLAFNLIDYQEFEQKKINEYLKRIELNRSQFELGEKEVFAEQSFEDWKSGELLQNIKMGADEMWTVIEQDVTNEILNYGVLFLDIVDIILLIVAIVSLIFGIVGSPATSGTSLIPAVILFIVHFGLSAYIEDSRSTVLKEILLENILDDIVFNENNALLVGLNKNTELYYNSGKDLKDSDVLEDMNEPSKDLDSAEKSSHQVGNDSISNEADLSLVVGNDSIENKTEELSVNPGEKNSVDNEEVLQVVKD